MRIPVSLAWSIAALAVFTAGLLRRYHEGTPASPFLHPLVGNLLFAAIFVLLLVASRERSRGAVPGPGVRLGSLTPLLLMLLIEKWISLGLYEPLFSWIVRSDLHAALDDAAFRLFAGAGLLLTCLLLGRLSVPARRKTARRLSPRRLPAAIAQVGIVIAGTYALLGGLAFLLGQPLAWNWAQGGPLLGWVVAGQAAIALGEEVYYRGLLYCEVERLSPRMGVRAAALKRWIAIGATSVLFAMEHVEWSGGIDTVLRQGLFACSLGALFALLAVVSANLYLAAGIHLWINCLLLGAAPHFAAPGGGPLLPAGTYVGVTLTLAFVVAYVFARYRVPGGDAAVGAVERPDEISCR